MEGPGASGMLPPLGKSARVASTDPHPLPLSTRERRDGRRRGRAGTLVAATALFSLLVIAAPAHAVEPDEILSDPVLETRARAISEGLRCLVCQNQSIDDSAAPLARDLRVIVREHLKAGDSDDAIRDYLVHRYGDFVLLKPPFERSTLLLWGTPALVVVLGGLGLLRRRRAADVPAPLTAEEQARVAALMADTRG